jgi:hypothetical protein
MWLWAALAGLHSSFIILPSTFSPGWLEGGFGWLYLGVSSFCVLPSALPSVTVTGRCPRGAKNAPTAVVGDAMLADRVGCEK